MKDIKQKIIEANNARRGLLSYTNAYRIINGVTDSFPGLTLDKFDNCYQIQFFSSELILKKNEIIKSIKEIFSPKCIVIKERLSRSGLSLENAPMQIALGSLENTSSIVFEGKAKFYVDLMDTINPGLFLDMRHIRLEIFERISKIVSHKNEFNNEKGLRFLNLFSYTCSFSVHARLAGVDIATNVDISSKILEKGRENYSLNNLELRPGEFFRGNAIEYVKWAIKKGLKFDAIVLDPPSFARFKGLTFNVRDNLMPLVYECAKILNKNGFFMVSSNYSEFTLESFSCDVLKTIKQVHENAKLVWKRSQDVDFKGSGITKDSCLVATLIEV